MVLFQEQNGDDVFVHFQSIVADGYKTLNENDKVEFVVTDGEKGPQASDVRVSWLGIFERN